MSTRIQLFFNADKTQILLVHLCYKLQSRFFIVYRSFGHLCPTQTEVFHSFASKHDKTFDYNSSSVKHIKRYIF